MFQIKRDGMRDKQPLLSICIPTYNGGDRLKICLDFITSANIRFHEVEVIVSDNCSTDNTAEIVGAFAHIRYFRNEYNLGFNGNIKLLIDQYARGKYCWIIGDDDYLDFDAIDKVCKILKELSPAFVSVRHRCMTLEELTKQKIDKNRNIEYISTSFFKCLDENASKSNVLGTFMSSQIFLLDRVKNFDKTIFGNNNWNNFVDTFPNSYMMVKVFASDGNCCCIKTSLITAISHAKSWDDKMYEIVMDILPRYYEYCILFAGSDQLRKTNDIINENILRRNLVELKSCRFSRIRWKGFLYKKNVMYFWNFLKRRLYK